MKIRITKIPRDPNIEITNLFCGGGKLFPYGGGMFHGSGAGGSWDDTTDTYPEVTNFNEAFDKAVAEGLPEFLFQGRRYNTQKENNPVREYNNRWVGQGRKANIKNPSKAYDRQAGPLGGPLAAIPMVTDTYIGSPERPPVLEYNPFAMERGKMLPYSWSNVVDRPKTVRALGGDIQNNGADFTTGLTHISAGGSHEENPNEGVQVGVDSEGTPNLVEENETIFNDYVYSNRIELDEDSKKAFHIGKKKKITYAEMSKRLEKEASERPNDPISQAALKMQLQDLAEQQERQKAEMEQQRVRDAFEALTPEEQAELMQYAGQQQQAEDAAMQEQALAQQQAMAMQQQAPMEMAPQEVMPQEQMAIPADGNVSAYGGPVNKFAGTQSGSNRMYNAGKFKTGTISENWNTYTRNGLRDYLQDAVERMKKAKSLKEADAIRKEAVDTVNNIQKAYAKAYQSNLSPSAHNAAVEELQEAFQKAGGNKYFDKIAENIDIPKGANTNDRVDRGWVDGFWGPRTSIRNWGSTEYGNQDYGDIVELARQLGANYAPNAEFTYGSADNPYQLYGLSLFDPTSPEGMQFDADWVNRDMENYNNEISPNPNQRIVGMSKIGQTTPFAVTNGSDEFGNVSVVSTPVPADGIGGGSETGAKEDPTDWTVKPKYRNENLRYMGLLGPAVGLGMMAAGIGKPDKGQFDAILNTYDSTGARYADYKPLGNYLTYRPMDLWAEQNRMNANARATDRALMNNSAPVGTRAAGLLANAYNNQVASGQLYRQGLEYNNDLNERVQTFNRQTDQYNADAYNRVSLANADIANRDRQYRAQLAMQGAAQKADMDAGWYNSLYGNVSGIFKGLSDLGRENAQHNMIADMAASGLFGRIDPDRVYIGNKYLTKTPNYRAKCGGKLNRKKGGK